VLDLKNMKNNCLLVSYQYNIQVPFDVLCSIPRWMMFLSTRIAKALFCSMCHIMKLQRMHEEPDNGVMDPTDLAVKPASNQFNIPISSISMIFTLQSAQDTVWETRIGS